MLEISERLRKSPFGKWYCFGKSITGEHDYSYRNDMLYCMRREPVLTLLDIGSYIK